MKNKNYLIILIFSIMISACNSEVKKAGRPAKELGERNNVASD